MSINKDYYWHIERSCDRIAPVHLKEISLATDVSLSWLVHGDDAPPIVELPGETIGERIRALRMSTGLGVRAFARTIGQAQRSSSLSAWESGRCIPELRSLLAISQAYYINVQSLIP